MDTFWTLFERFLSPGGSDFNFVFFVGLVGSSVKFRLPTWLLFETLFFGPYKGPGQTLHGKSCVILHFWRFLQAKSHFSICIDTHKCRAEIQGDF